MHRLRLLSTLRKLPLRQFRNRKGRRTNVKVDLSENLTSRNELEVNRRRLAVTLAGRVRNDEVSVDSVPIDCVLFPRLLYRRRSMKRGQLPKPKRKTKQNFKNTN